MTFKTLQDKAYKNTLLNTSYFAEQVLLIRNYGRAEDPAAAAALISAAIIAGSYMTVSISEAEEDPVIEDHRFTREEEILVQCSNDPSAVNADSEALGGLADPNIHDAILRDVSVDPLQIPFMYVHESKHRSGVLWRLTFRRHLQGTQQVST